VPWRFSAAGRLSASIDLHSGSRKPAQQRKCPPHSFTSSASANDTGGAVMFGGNASER